ncbi:MAG: membrane protein insertase YidC [Candidatus Omnitrophica bacterium]|nr:membrane protein insertase YidC [Candidatus Omnitrophota bacterium]
MDKRTVLAIGLSLLVLLSWSAFVSKTQPVANKAVMTTGTLVSQPASVTPSSIPAPTSASTPALPEEVLKVKRDNIEISFIESKAAIKGIYFQKHKYTFPLGNGLSFGPDEWAYKLIKNAGDEIVFVHAGSQERVTKKFIFDKSNYTIGLELLVENLAGQPLKISSPLYLGTLDFAPKNQNAPYQGVTAFINGDAIYPNARKDWEMSNVKYISLHERYFCGLISPESASFSAFIKKGNGNSFIGLIRSDWTIPAGQTTADKFAIYLGPQDLRLLQSINPNWGHVIYYGKLDFIAQILLQSLEFIHKLVPNWGWTIVIFSLLIYLVLYPLTLKQMRSMKEMQALQPKIEALRKVNKDNPQKLNKEIMELYKEHKVNPLGGCLPLLLQMPIFFALYQVLMRAVALRGAKFLWIKDLSAPDQLFRISGFDVNILPILMAIGMFVQQKMSIVAGATSETAQQQKMMLVIMPLMFGFIFYKMPSGLVLYWFINSALMMVYQVRTRYSK